VSVEASIADVREKAKRIRAEGGVRIIADQDGEIVAYVKGDHNVYQTSILRAPGSKAISAWTCGCPWGSVSWGRSGRWKKYEGRGCSHLFALQYEAQSRGMFGKEITLDTEKPEWQDDSLPIRTPGEFDISKGKYAMVREAGMNFKALVDGVLRHLTLRPDGIFDGDTNVDHKKIMNPAWSPTLGLHLSDQRRGSRQHLARTLLAAADSTSAAQALSDLATASEPGITPLVQGAADQAGATTFGDENKIKDPGALASKVDEVMPHNGMDRSQAAAAVPDSLRYGMTLDPDTYAQGVDGVMSTLQSQGVKPAQVSPWSQDSPGTTVNAHGPDGHPFEIQFHTPDSLAAHEQSAGDKDTWSTSDDPSDRRQAMDSIRATHGAAEMPLGADQAGSAQQAPAAQPDPSQVDPAAQPQPVQAHRLAADLPAPPAPAQGQDDPDTDPAALAEDDSEVDPQHYTYFKVVGANGDPKTVFRLYDGPDDSRTEVWRDGEWEMDQSFGRYVHGTEAGATPIQEDEANQIIGDTDQQPAVPQAPVEPQPQVQARMKRNAARWLQDNMRWFGQRAVTALRRIAMSGYDLPMEAYAAMLEAKSAAFEPEITRTVTSVVTRNKGKMDGLAFKLKGYDSLLRKLISKENGAVKQDNSHGTGPLTSKYADRISVTMDLQDVLRYTAVTSSANYVDMVKNVQNGLTSAGYKTVSMDNSWYQGSEYKGINANFMAPGGMVFELQFHTPPSLKVKEANHEPYEVYRLDTTSKNDKSVLFGQMAARTNSIPWPSGDYTGLGKMVNRAKSKYASLVTAFSDGGGTWEYFQSHHTLDKNLLSVFRMRNGLFEEFQQGSWVDNHNLAAHLLKGESGWDGISMSRAREIVQAQGGDASQVTASRTGGDPFWNRLNVVANVDAPYTPEPMPVPQPRTAAAAPASHWDEASGWDAPEPALPVTYGEEQKTAMKRQALKDFSHGERQMLINEGNGARARTFSSLDVAGTMYADIPDTDDDWMGF
jgi:hypothetical protein